jgi:hypothetical protein
MWTQLPLTSPCLGCDSRAAGLGSWAVQNIINMTRSNADFGTALAILQCVTWTKAGAYRTHPRASPRMGPRVSVESFKKRCCDTDTDTVASVPLALEACAVLLSSQSFSRALSPILG